MRGQWSRKHPSGGPASVRPVARVIKAEASRPIAGRPLPLSRRLPGGLSKENVQECCIAGAV